MKLGIETYSETDWKYSYVILRIDNKRWCGIPLFSNGSVKVYNY